MGFCPRCGKPTQHQFCLDCLRELKPLVTDMKLVQGIMCPSCLRTYTTTWGNKPLDDIIRKQLERRITFQEGSRIDETILEQPAIEPGKQLLALTVIGSADTEGESYEEYYEIVVLIEGRRCTQCEHQANAYFTGIFQLRNPNDIVAAAIEKGLGKSLTNVKDVKGGVDYYVADKRLLANVSRQVQAEFGGEITIRAQHFSYDGLTSRNLYRVNACLRLPKFWVGDVIEAATKIVLIKSMGKRMKVMDIENGKVFSTPFMIDYPMHERMKTTVVSTKPLTVLHPETYETASVENAEQHSSLEPGTTIEVVDVDSKLYAVNE